LSFLPDAMDKSVLNVVARKVAEKARS